MKINDLLGDITDITADIRKEALVLMICCKVITTVWETALSFPPL